MRQLKKVGSFCLAILLTLTIFVVPASAKSLDAQSVAADAKNFAKIEVWIYTHIGETVEIIEQLIDGSTEALDKYFPDPELNELFLRTYNIPKTTGALLKTTLILVNPSNTEKYVIPTVEFNVPQNVFPTNSGNRNSGNNRSFTLLANDIIAAPAAFSLTTFIAYKNSANELVVWGMLANDSGEAVEIFGIPSVVLSTNGKVFASGKANAFETSMKMAPHETQANTGVYDGLPTRCLVKLTFKPGTYDETVDISSLDNVSCSFALDYKPVK